MLPCFGWYCVERAHSGLLPLQQQQQQPGGNQRLRRAGEVRENQVQSAAVISSVCRGWLSPPPSHRPPWTPLPPSSFLHRCSFSPLPFSLDKPHSILQNWTAPGPDRPLLSVTYGRSHLKPVPVGCAVMPKAALRYPAPAEPPYPARLSHVVQQSLTLVCWE